MRQLNFGGKHNVMKACHSYQRNTTLPGILFPSVVFPGKMEL